MWKQKNLTLPPEPAGFHLITQEVLLTMPEITKLHVGILHLFLQHTSAGLTINEDADPSVREDFKSFIDRLIPENQTYFRHTLEGSDDMPAHLKSSLLGHSLTIPIEHGCLLLGTWQGIYLCEYRHHGGKRKIILTLHGE